MFVSRDSDIGHPADSWQLIACEVRVEITEAGFEVFQCVSLGPVVGEPLEIADPNAIFLPIDNLGCVHAAALQAPLVRIEIALREWHRTAAC